MSKVQRSTDIVETIAAKAMALGFIGLALLGIGTIIWVVGTYGTFRGLAVLLVVMGAILIVTAVGAAWKVKDITHVGVDCPCCGYRNLLTESPSEDFPCVSCNRMVPISDGKPMPVQQVRCGFCNALNYYSDKTEVLICEECDREIPIGSHGDAPIKKIPRGFTRVDDEALYELVLTGTGKDANEAIATLQQMLALNRNQVKDIIDTMPTVLLTGINRRKAEMLQAQLTVHGAEAEIRPLSL